MALISMLMILTAGRWNPWTQCSSVRLLLVDLPTGLGSPQVSIFDEGWMQFCLGLLVECIKWLLSGLPRSSIKHGRVEFWIIQGKSSQ